MNDIIDQIQKQCDHRLLTAREERELGRLIKQGGPEGQRAKDKLVEHNMRLVFSTADWFRTHGGLGTPFEDLFQAGVVGLVKAADKFDPDRGFKFSTYASWWIRQSIQRLLQNGTDLIHVPNTVRRAQLTAVNNPDMTDEEIAAKHEISRKQVRFARRAPAVVSSLDAYHGDSDHADWDAADPHAEQEFEELTEQGGGAWLVEAIEDLPAEIREPLELRFGLDGNGERTPTEVAELLGVSPGLVSDRCSRALTLLRRAAKNT